MIRVVGHVGLVVLLTIVTQLGGLAWLGALVFRRRLLAFMCLYAVIWLAAVQLAPFGGRQALPCFGTPLQMQSPFYCVTMRHFVDPELAELAQDAAARVAGEYPGTITLALDGGFPFVDGFPLLPHLSHSDGEKLDFAFYYRDADGVYVPGLTRSPLGYFAFDALDHDQCPKVWPTMRWNLRPLQSLFPDRPLEPQRTKALAAALLEDPRLGKMFLEPPLSEQLGLSHSKLRFQGCRAARHDDHIHIQL